MPKSLTMTAKFEAGTLVSPALWGALALLPVAAILLAASGAPVPGLSIVIAALTLFVGALVASYSTRYMRSDSGRQRFFVMLGSLVAAVLLFVVTGNALVFAIGWLASGQLLAGLIGHRGDWAEARAAARRSRLTFALGDAPVMVALGLLCWHSGSFHLDTAVAQAADLPGPIVALVAVFLLVGAAARCALPPFSGWLMSSMTAPTPVSALMHAGLVNAGGFLLLRFAPVLEAATAVRYAAVALGFFAAVWGIGVMAVRPDLKRSLAGSTVSQMGFMIMSCGLGAYAAALWHIVAHGLFKAWQFLGAGSAIGMNIGRRPALDPRTVTVVATVAAATGIGLVVLGSAGAELVPLLLATATGAAVFLSIVTAKAFVQTRLALSALLAAIVAAHAAGLAIARAALPVDASDLLLSPVLTIALLGAFLACWVWQSRLIASQRPLPASLYVRLLNAGALRPA